MEVEYHPNFVILYTRNSSPACKPELQAQYAPSHFVVSKNVLEDKLLGAEAARERPDLEELGVCMCTQYCTHWKSQSLISLSNSTRLLGPAVSMTLSPHGLHSSAAS